MLQVKTLAFLFYIRLNVNNSPYYNQEKDIDLDLVELT